MEASLKLVFSKFHFEKWKRGFWLRESKTLFAFLRLIAQVNRVHHKPNWLIHKTLKCMYEEREIGWHSSEGFGAFLW